MKNILVICQLYNSYVSGNFLLCGIIYFLIEFCDICPLPSFLFMWHDLAALVILYNSQEYLRSTIAYMFTFILTSVL